MTHRTSSADCWSSRPLPGMASTWGHAGVRECEVAVCPDVATPWLLATIVSRAADAGHELVSSAVGRNSVSSLGAMTGGSFGGRLWADPGLNTTIAPIAPRAAGAPTAPSFLDRSLSALDSPVRSRWQQIP